MSVVGAPMRAYYERRAREYDDWWLGTGLFAGRERPGWRDEVQQLIATLEEQGAVERGRHEAMQADEAGRFPAKARRVAPELVVVDSARRPETGAEQWQARRLDDGSEHRVYKRWFTGAGLAGELGGGEVLLDGEWFVAVRAITPARAPVRP